MKIERLVDNLAISGILLAFSSSAIVASSALVFDSPIDVFLPIIAFFITFTSYHINRKAEMKEDMVSHPNRTLFIVQNKWLDYLAVIGYATAFLLAAFRNVPTLVITIAPPLCVLLYSYRFHPKVKRVKDVTLLKNIYVSAAWMLCMLITATYYNKNINSTVFALAIFLFIRTLINATAFDVRDTTADMLNNVKTLPVLIGEKNTLKVLFLVNTFGGLYLFYAVYAHWLEPFVISLNLATIHGYYYLIELGKKSSNKNFLCDVVGDGGYLLWPVFLIIGKMVIG